MKYNATTMTLLVFMVPSFNYFNFFPDQSCFVHQFGMADGSKHYNTH